MPKVCAYPLLFIHYWCNLVFFFTSLLKYLKVPGSKEEKEWACAKMFLKAYLGNLYFFALPTSLY